MNSKDFVVGCLAILVILVVFPLVAAVIKISLGLLLPVIMLAVVVVVIAFFGRVIRTFLGGGNGRPPRRLQRPRDRYHRR